MTNKISVSISDTELLEWAQARATREGKSLSAVIVAALRFEHQLEQRRNYLASWPERPKLTAEETAAIHAEWAGGPRYEPKRTKTAAPALPRGARKKRQAV
jgi:hypothetical protein